MKSQKLIVAAFSVVACFFVIYFVVNGFFGGGMMKNSLSPALSSDKSNATSSQNNISSGIGDTSIKWVEKLGGGTPSNLTEKLSGNLTSEFMSNINFNKASSSKDLLGSIDFNNLNAESLSKILKDNPLAFVSEVKDSEVKISSDNSEEAKNLYKKTYASIIKNNLTFLSDSKKIETAIENSISGNNNKSIESMIDGFDKAHSELAGLSVPSSFVDFHKSNLKFVSNFSLVLETIANNQNDPLMTLLALDFFSSDLSENWGNIGNLIKTEF